MVAFRLVRILLIVGLITGFFGHHFLSATAFAKDAPDAIVKPIPLSNIVQVTAGTDHACALTTQGGVKCWGGNSEGQLGDGTEDIDRLTPVDVVGLKEVVYVAAGLTHTCALTKVGSVKCWGDNYDGELGDGTTTNRFTPVDVLELTSGVKAIAVGSAFTCAVTSTGGVKCWGDNFSGQLGDNTTINRWTPVDVFGLSGGVATVTAGHAHACALTTDGVAKCWGANSDGQLGDGTIIKRLKPTNVSGVPNPIATLVAGGFHTCEIPVSGYTRCWGRNDSGQLGNGTTDNQPTPQIVDGIYDTIVAVGAGSWHNCLLTLVGGVKCWGNNIGGELGDGTEIDRLLPVDIYGLTSGITSVVGGNSFTCALTDQGGVKCWGAGDSGQLGDAMDMDRSVPGDVFTIGICYALSVSHNGNGANPAVTPSQSQGCPPNHYLPGAVMALVAAPATNAYVLSWGGTNRDTSRDPANLMTMPAADHSASVSYGVCHMLTVKHTGEGANPVAVLGQSAGCTLGKYAAGDVMTLVAAPGAEQRVQSWVGAAQSPADGIAVNTLTMPNADTAVSVAYEPCFGLVASVQGEGELLQANPTATTGCEAGAYIAGQTVTLLAAPATGWRVAGWGGTANDGSADVMNSVMMVAGDAAVEVLYMQVADGSQHTVSLFLPNVTR